MLVLVLALKTEGKHYSETSVNVYWTAVRHISEYNVHNFNIIFLINTCVSEMVHVLEDS
jgi:hypothetical protein